MRYVLEVGAAEAAARRTLTDQDRNYLQQRLKEATDVSLTDFRRHDSLLHLGIAEAVGSPSLTSAVAEVRGRLNELLDAIPLLARNIQHSKEQHAEIVSAILIGRRRGRPPGDGRARLGHRLAAARLPRVTSSAQAARRAAPARPYSSTR